MLSRLKRNRTVDHCHGAHAGVWLLTAYLATASACIAFAQDDGSHDRPKPSRTLLIDFVGGFVHSDDTRHPEVEMMHHFQHRSIPGLDAEIFKNSDTDAAEKRILQFLDENRDGKLSPEEKQSARVILLGHSWGGAAVMTVAQELDRQNIPVMLLIQVDGVGKFAPRSCDVPANVREAMNFYQTKLPIRGCQTFRAVDPAKTRILGNVRMEYEHQPPECRELPWRDRVFLRSHNSLGCDPHLWAEIERQLDTALGTGSASP